MTPLALGVATTVAVALLALACGLLTDAWSGRPGPRSVVEALGVSATAWIVWALVVLVVRPELDGVPLAVVGAMAGLAAVLVSATARLQGLGYPGVVGLAALSTAAVFAPVAIDLFSSDGVLGGTLAILDLAGALPVLVAAGGGSIGILLLSHCGRRQGNLLSAGPAVLVPTLLAVWVLWVAWMVGLESAIDEATPRIVTSGIVAPLASAAVWLVVQRAVHARTTAVGVVGGLFCGMAAIAPAAASLDLVGATLTGAITGAVCSSAGYALSRWSGHPAWMLAVVLALGAGLGTGLLGAFAMRSGLMFTGQPEVLFSQFAGVALVLAWSVVATSAGWLLVNRVTRRPPAPLGSRSAGR